MSQAPQFDLFAALSQKRKQPPTDLFSNLFGSNSNTQKPQIKNAPKMGFNEWVA